MTSTDWRSDEGRARMAKEIISSDPLREMLMILESEPPSNMPLPNIGSSDSDKSMALGMEYGYRHCLYKLRSLAQYQPAMTQVQSTFEHP